MLLGREVDENRMANLWVPLVDAPLETGPLRVIPSSHRWGCLPYYPSESQIGVAATAFAAFGVFCGAQTRVQFPSAFTPLASAISKAGSGVFGYRRCNFATCNAHTCSQDALLATVEAVRASKPQKTCIAKKHLSPQFQQWRTNGCFCSPARALHSQHHVATAWHHT